MVKKHLACIMPAPTSATQSSAIGESFTVSEVMPMCRGIRAAEDQQGNAMELELNGLLNENKINFNFHGME